MTMPMLDIVVKGTVLLVLGTLLIFAARRATAAAQRHFAWTLVLAGLLALPALSALPISLPVLPATPNSRYVENNDVENGGVENGGVQNPTSSFSTPSLSTPPGTSTPSVSPAPPGGWSPEQILTSLWIVGAIALLARIGAALVAALWLIRSAREVADHRWQLALAGAADELGVIAPVRLVESRRARIPMTFGLRRPVIVLPAEAFVWDDEARRVVLLHELSHVKRGDMITCLLGQIVTALYWFNPLVWVAAHRLRVEAEQACDDMVLQAGAVPSDYAGQLLAIVQAAGREPVPALAMPMAQPSAFEGRILAILQPDAARHGLTRRAVAAGVLMLLAVAVPLAALAPARAEPQTTDDRGAKIERRVTDDRGAKIERRMTDDRAPMTGNTTSVIGSQASVSVNEPRAADVTAGLIAALGDESAPVRVAAARALGELADTAAINALLEALRRDSSREVRRMAAWALGNIEDARAVNGLVAALREERDREVRLAIVRALGEIESAEAVPGLGSALRGADVEMQRAIVWALGEIESAEAVPLLTGLLDDADVELRRQTAWALGEIESPAAVDALASALGSERNDSVREQLVWALGEIEDPRAGPALERALRDASVQIRRRAAWAIGEIDGLRSAPPGLIEALRDVDLEVRKAAAHALGEMDDISAVPGLVAALENAELDLRRIIVHSLGELPSAAAAQALVALLQDADPEIRRLAAHALGNR